MVEGAPIYDASDTESVSDDKESDKKKKRKSFLEIVADNSKEADKDKDAAKKPERSWFNRFNEEEKSEAEKPADSEVETATVEEAPDETVGEAEKPAVEKQLVELIREEEAAREADPDTDAPVERFRELVEDGTDSDQAYEEVMSDLGVEEVDADVDDIDSDELPAEPEEELVFDRSLESDTEAEDEDTPVPVTPGGSTPPPPPVPPTANNPGGTGTPPGGPPTPPFGPGPPVGPGGPFGGGPAGFNPNVIPATPALDPNQRAHNYDWLDDRASPAAMALAGGIIGYLIGRRRGRIKTEKKLLPIQKKLEKQVGNLKFELQEKEKKIRKVAAEKVKAEGVAAIEAFRKPLPEKAAEERVRAAEAKELHVPKRTEHIGHVIVTAEAKSAGASEKRAVEKIESQSKPVAEKRVENLSRAELLGLSEKIIVDGSSLRQIYESHLIGERGLRRLVGEHLRGGDLPRALRREIVEREIDFERDPVLRDMAPTTDSSGGSGAPAGINQFLEKAATSLPESEETAFFKAKAAHDAQQLRQQQKQSRLVDVTLSLVIMILLSVIVYLALSRHSL